MGECPSSAECRSKPNEFCVSIAVAVPIAILFVLMIITILSLTCYLIYKYRNSNLGSFTQYTVPATTATEYVRQASKSSDAASLGKKTNCRISFHKNESTFTIFDESNFEMNEMYMKDNAAPNIIDTAIYSPVNIINMQASMQHIISPDKMRELCTGVLMRMKRNESASLTHLDKLRDEYKKDTETLEKYTTEDNALSEMEDYDALPKPIPLNNEVTEQIYNDMYDSPHQAGEWDPVKDYKMPRPSEGPFAESSYMNARRPLL